MRPLRKSPARPRPRLCASIGLSASLLAVTWTASGTANEERGFIRQFTDVRADLQSPDFSARLLAIERLGASPLARSRIALVAAVRALADTPSGSKASTHENPDEKEQSGTERARMRLALARALAGHTAHPEARQALLRLMNASAEGAEPHDVAALHTAALSLVRSGAPEAVGALVRSLWHGTSLSDAARHALVSHPPTRFDLLLAAPPSDALVDLLGELKDPRAYDLLRQVLRDGPATRAARAAWALFQLGVLETGELARHWWKTSQDPAHRHVALRILVETEDDLAPEALRSLLTDLPDNVRVTQSALEWAARAPHPSWEEPLLKLARKYLSPDRQDKNSHQERALTLEALARLDQPKSVALLVVALGGPHAAAAAEALARTDGQQASTFLTKALAQPARRAWALRVLAVREARGALPAGHVKQPAAAILETKSTKASSDTDRAAAAWALAVTAPEQAAPLLASDDSVLALAVARQAFRAPLTGPAVQRLVTASVQPTDATSQAFPTQAFWHACHDPKEATKIPTHILASLLRDGSGAIAPILFAWVARARQEPGLLALDGDMNFADVRSALESSDPLRRAAVASGLAHAKTPSATGLLARVLAWDTAPVVRRAAALALSRRREPARLRALEQAAGFDPDPDVRTLAQAALAPPYRTSESPKDASLPLFWQLSDGPLSLVTAQGQHFWLHPDPDGFVGVFALEAEPWQVRPATVANPAPRGEASGDR